MSDLDEELYGLIADDDSDSPSPLNELEKEQKLAEVAEKRQIKEDKRKLSEMLKNRGKKTIEDDETDFSGDDSGDDFLVQQDSDDVAYKMRDKRDRMETKPPDLNQLRNLQLSRDKLTEIVFRKDFEDIVIGAFVRVPVRENTCRICEIVEVVVHKLYNLNTDTRTDKSLIIRYGTDKTRIYMDRISNSQFESEEWKRWLLKMKEDIKKNPQDIRHMQEEEILNKMEVLNVAMNKSITEEELAHIINERKKILGENKTMLKLNLKRQLAVALSAHDESEIIAIKSRLAQLGEHEPVIEQKIIPTAKKQPVFIIPKINLSKILGATTDSLDDIDVEELLE